MSRGIALRCDPAAELMIEGQSGPTVGVSMQRAGSGPLKADSAKSATGHNRTHAMQQRVPSGSAKATCRKRALSCAVRSRPSLGCRQIRFGRIGTSLPDAGMTDPSLAFGAWMGDRLVGSSPGSSWGSWGIFGLISTPPTPGITGLPSWDLFKHSTSFARAGWKARRSSRCEAVGDALL